MKKEQFMLRVYEKVADDHYNKMIKTVKIINLISAYLINAVIVKYLTKVSEPSGGEETEQADIVLREGSVHYCLNIIIY